jgi:hypothetical protein
MRSNRKLSSTGGSMRTCRYQTSLTGLSGPSLHLLVYRYLFFDWLFRDVNHGSFLERAAAWRFNREMRRYLPIYLRRWVILVVCSYLLGAVSEGWFSLNHAAAFFYGVTSVSVAMAMLIVRSWLGLKYG